MKRGYDADRFKSENAGIPLIFIGRTLWLSYQQIHSKHQHVYGNGLCTKEHTQQICQHVSPAILRQAGLSHTKVMTELTKIGRKCQGRLKPKKGDKEAVKGLSCTSLKSSAAQCELQPLWAAVKHDIALARLGASNNASKASQFLTTSTAALHTLLASNAYDTLLRMRFKLTVQRFSFDGPHNTSVAMSKARDMMFHKMPKTVLSWYIKSSCLLRGWNSRYCKVF